MKRAHDFDLVFDTQTTFRLILEAMSNPGRIVKISNLSKKIYSNHHNLLSIALTLLDNEVTFYSCQNRELAGEISSLTLAKEVELQEADFIFVPSINSCELSTLISQAKCGTLKSPHKSATLIFEVDSLEGMPNTILKGPGIKSYQPLFLDDYCKMILELRANNFFEYPLGIDLLLVSKIGELVSLVRTTKTEEM